MQGVSLHKAVLKRAKLENADLREGRVASWSESGDWKASSIAADLTDAVLDEGELADVNLAGADLCGSSGKDADLSGAILTDAKFNNADWRKANLS